MKVTIQLTKHTKKHKKETNEDIPPKTRNAEKSYAIVGACFNVYKRMDCGI